MNTSVKRLRWRAIVYAALAMIASLCLFTPNHLWADNHVYVDIAELGAEKGADTLFVGKHYVVRYYIRNDIELGEIRIASSFWGGIVGKSGTESRAGHFWEWLDVGGYGSICAAVTCVPGCRMDPPETVWEDAFYIFEWNMNEDSPDTIGIRGVALVGGLLPGTSQHMLSVHFTPRMPSYGMITMWHDTAFIPLTGGLNFYDMGGTLIYPTYTSPGDWPIALVCGDANGDGQANVGDAVFVINYVFKGGPAPQPVQAGDANCDVGTDVGDAVYLINYVFKSGPAPCCPPL